MTASIHRFSVVGTPITHSLSPRMHNAAFDVLHASFSFDALDPQTPIGFAKWCEDVKKQVGQGAGVGGFCTTIPYKQEAFRICDVVSEKAQLIGAVNVVTRMSNGTLKGDNTDAPGFLRALTHELQAQGVAPLSRTSRIVLCGTGGVARAIIVALIGAEVGTIVVSSRSLARAREFIAEFQDFADNQGVTLEPAENFAQETWPLATCEENLVRHHALNQHVHVCVNATPRGLGASDTLIVNPDWMQMHASFVFDAVYAKEGATNLIVEARRRGIPCVDGRLMLAEQGIAAQEIWNETYHFWDNKDEAQRAQTALRAAL